jgi:phosphoribosylglycinamide formyltransferase-1
MIESERPTPNETSTLAARRQSIRIAVFASGAGTTLQGILDGCAGRQIPGQVVVIVCNVPGAGAIARAERGGVPVEIVDHRTSPHRATFERSLFEAVERYRADLVCLAGFLRILSPSFVRPLKGRIMNIHPSLLPAFGGKGMYGERVHAAVLEHGVKVTGCTVHFVDESPDGGPIILQRAVSVADDDTPASLGTRVQVQERDAYREAICLFAEGRLSVKGRRVQILPAGRANELRPQVLA